MSNEIIYVKSSAEFPSWKNPCPKCGSKYEKGKKSGISSTRDGSRAWCYGCQTNWKIGQDPRPEGWNELGGKLGVKTEPKEKINIATEMMSKLQTIETTANSCHNMLNTIIDILNKEMPTE